jgi:predicted kinase
LDAAQRAQAHWLLALSVLEEPGKRPCLLLMAGLPGTGKSRLSQALAEKAGFSLIRSDVVRKELAAREGGVSESIYTPEWNARTYTECLHRAERLLFEGKRVVIDATFREEKQRRKFLDAAVRWGVQGVIFLCRAQPETVRLRLKQRKGDASDADWSIYLHLAAGWEEPGALTRRFCHDISTERSPAESLTRALEALRQMDLIQ